MYDTDTVPHELAEDDGDVDTEPDGLTVPLLLPVTDGLYDADTVGDDDNVDEIVDEVESVPDPDCDNEFVLQGDAVNVRDTVPHALAEDDGDDIVEPDALSDQLFELHPDDVYELDSVDEIVGDGESVPDPDCDTERVPQGDAVNETDTVPQELNDGECDVVNEPDGLTVPLVQLVTDEL